MAVQDFDTLCTDIIATGPSLADKVRRGRLAALASLRAKAAASQNVVSIFDNVLPLREAVPVFHSRRVKRTRPMSRLLLTNPTAA
ncbi:hypothetical protein [Maritimibacter sp. DP1N21-5]|uniref:hypothetical protein n=1 Tax=Maritimibacter sp. DP1N21-5 TaxID=2836867 RepID=UPI001C480DC0|nr:hypothetical protein [Maritimibacter sp. DP1N21-5]MBV7407588.1 hypothetical protein [Maritimibacter sp. DP1N21-5]